MMMMMLTSDRSRPPTLAAFLLQEFVGKGTFLSARELSMFVEKPEHQATVRDILIDICARHAARSTASSLGLLPSLGLSPAPVGGVRRARGPVERALRPAAPSRAAQIRPSTPTCSQRASRVTSVRAQVRHCVT